MIKFVYYPITPGETVCTWLKSESEKEAWKKLLKDTEHTPYKTKKDLIKRGYRVEKFEF